MMLRPLAALVTACLAFATPDPASAEGKYSRRQKARGETTDTAPKLDRHAFINDEAPDPLRLVLVVDAWTARHPHDARVLPLVVAMSYEGNGPALPIRPDRFELAWDGSATPLRALEQAALIDACGGTSPVYHDLRMRSRRAPLAFDTPRADYISVQFYSHPLLRTLRHDRLQLVSRRWFSTLMYFRLPDGFAAWDSLFDVRYVAEDGAAPLVACRFRIERDPAMNAGAMRRARKDVRDEGRGAGR